MEPLPFAREEVRRIGELFAPKSRRVLFGTAASEDAVRAHVEKTTHLHIAAHGIIDESRPSRSGLLVGISIDGRDDGILSMNEIYRLRLDADLAVLSGCSTGRGEMLRGEGIVGLTRAFLYAGARSVVVSLWNVNDRSTAPLMEAFYREMIGGRPAASALRQAKIGMLRSADRAHRHPARWAPFVLIGDSIGGDSIGEYPEGGSIQADS